VEALTQVLRQLPRPSHPNLLVGTEHFDDAGVYRLSDTLAIVQTVDFFPPLVDDPFTFGQIAAANSLSDIYAMGAQPLTALSIVGFPDKELDAQILCDILCGGAERVEAAGAVIVGGHSVRDVEVKFGLAVTGTIHPDRIVTNGGAKPGDVLILTKPIGSAQLTTAAKAGKIAESELTEAIDVMIELNAGACQAMLEVGVSAATDITGFGLIGHAFEMADASGAVLEIDAAHVPLMNLALRLAREGVLTRAQKSNLAHVGDRLQVGRVDEALVKVLADAQTSGGLLISVPAERADGLVAALAARRSPCAAVIGRVLPGPEPGIRLN
jgi:selenide,water dikinase